MKEFTWITQHLMLKHVRQYDEILLTSQTLLVSKEAEILTNGLIGSSQRTGSLIFVRSTEYGFTPKGIWIRFPKKLWRFEWALWWKWRKIWQRHCPRNLVLPLMDGQNMVCTTLLCLLLEIFPNEGCVLFGFPPFEQENDLSSEQHRLYLTHLEQHYIWVEIKAKNIVI